jgi:mevalonate kinase
MSIAGAEPIRAIASAPGKVILFGEHAVVHGVTAVAAALSDLRIVAQAVSARTHCVHLYYV